MSQGVRDMLANRRFTIPLMILLAFCLVGLILIGVVLIWQPDFLDDGTTVAQASVTSPPEQTALPTTAPTATETATPRPSPTLVPLGTQPATTPEAMTSSEKKWRCHRGGGAYGRCVDIRFTKAKKGRDRSRCRNHSTKSATVRPCLARSRHVSS